MPHRCPACDGVELIFDGDALSWICARCGVLLDPTQAVLDHAPTAADDFYLWNPAAAMHSDGQPIWSLQTTETKRDQRKAARHRVIRRLLVGLGRSSDALYDRARTVFDAAQQKASRAWGSTRSETVAGAAVAVAVREAGLPESVGDIAALLSRPPIVIARAYRRLKETLGLEFVPNDPHIYLTMLTSHLDKILTELSPPRLPQKTRDYFTMSTYGPAVDLATRLLRIVDASRSSPDRLPSAVACGAFMLAFEGETQRAMPSKEKVAEALAGRLGIRGSTVMERYREIGRLVASVKDGLPRRSGVGYKKGLGGRNERVAWMKDVVLLWNELDERRRGSEAAGEEGSDWSDCRTEDGEGPDGGGVEGGFSPRAAVLAAAASLLAGGGGGGDVAAVAALRGALLQTATAVDAVWTRVGAGGRLSALALARGGAEHVLDAELFEPGELDAYVGEDARSTANPRLPAEAAEAEPGSPRVADREDPYAA